MNWQTVKPMDQKLFFITDYLRHTGSVTDLCARYGISRKTGYKWIKRYQDQGLEGLEEQTRRPTFHPEATPYRIRQAIISIRKTRHILVGAKKIQCALAKKFPNEHIPSHTTINNILRDEGLLRTRKKRQRVMRDTRPFAPVNEANACWSTDFKGQFKVANTQWCYPLTVMDHHSRYLLACDSLKGTGFKGAKQTFERLFKTYGLPERIRSDNGVPFATRAVGGLSQLSVWWIRLGIRPERIKPGCPQQNGCHERMHRTLKAATTRPVSSSLRAQQRQFNLFCEEYNELREHESLNQTTPASHYQPSPRPYPSRLPELVYPDYFERRRVCKNGVIYCRNGQVYLSPILCNEWIGLECIDDGIWAAYFGPAYLGQFNERHPKGKNADYWTLKV